MASRLQTVTRTVITRRPTDIDPKVVGVFAVAIATIAIVIAAYVVAALLGAQLPPALAASVVPVVLAALVGYARRSSHSELVDDGFAAAAAIAEALEPVLEQAAPGSAKVVAPVVDSLELIDQELARPDQP